MEDCTIWKDNQGKEHKLSEMSEEYILNCIKYLVEKRTEITNHVENNCYTESQKELYDWHKENFDGYVLAFGEELRNRL